MSVFNC